MAFMRGVAKETIKFGALVLCRNNEVRNADRSVANGTAKGRPRWGARQSETFEPGDWLHVVPVDGLAGRDLHAIAAGPIMEPLRLYLPAGKISEAEYQERLNLSFASLKGNV